MPTLLLVLLALSLPFGEREPLFRLGALPLNAPSFLALAAVAWSLVESLRGKIRPDSAGWAAIAWAGAWLVSSLAAPMAWEPASLTAWEMAAGPILFSCTRRQITLRSRNALLAALGTALVVSTFLHFAGETGVSLPGATPPLPRSAFTAYPMTGAGPGAYPGLPLWAGLWPRGGLLVALAGAFLLGTLARGIYRLSLRRKNGPGPLPPAALLVALILTGFFFNPLASIGPGLGFWLGMSVLLPAARGAYNVSRRA